MGAIAGLEKITIIILLLLKFRHNGIRVSLTKIVPCISFSLASDNALYSHLISLKF